MGMIQSIGRWLGARKETIDITNPQHAALFFGGPTKAGTRVTAQKAIEVAVVIGCLRAISEDVAKLPLTLRTRDEAAGFKPVPADHPVARVLKKPQPWMTGRELREAMQIVAALEGNAYAQIIKDGRGAVKELVWIPPGAVTILRDDETGAPVYELRAPNKPAERLDWSEVLHLQGWGPSPWAGTLPFRTAREAIGLTIATEESQSRLQANGARPSGLLSFDGVFGAEAAASLKEQFMEAHGGSDKVGGTIVLDRNAKWTQTQMSGVDSQHLETRKFQIEEICRIFRVLPIMVMQSDKASTFASAEMMFQQHLSITVAPWCDRWENEIELKLLTDPRMEVRHDMRAVLRPAAKDRAEFYAKMVINGILTRNEARLEEGYPKLDGLDEPLTPMNMTGGAGDEAKPEDDEAARSVLFRGQPHRYLQAVA